MKSPLTPTSVLFALVEALRDPGQPCWFHAFQRAGWLSGGIPSYEAQYDVWELLRQKVYATDVSAVYAEISALRDTLNRIEDEGVLVKGTTAPQPTWESQELEAIPTGLLDEARTLLDRPVSMVVRTEPAERDRQYVEYLERKAAEAQEQ